VDAIWICHCKPGTAPDRSWLAGEFDVTAQANMCADIAKDMGFSTECGRLDVSVRVYCFFRVFNFP
jgi:Zn-dependent M32 family carboxypeptidase